MITKEQAIEIVQKFEFFQGQRAGRELWATKPTAVQNADLASFSADCEDLIEYLQLADEPRYKMAGIPEHFWLIFDVPGFYDIVEYKTERVDYLHGKLHQIWGYHNQQSVVAYSHDFDRTVFFSKKAAQEALNKMIQEQRGAINGEM